MDNQDNEEKEASGSASTKFKEKFPNLMDKEYAIDPIVGEVYSWKTIAKFCRDMDKIRHAIDKIATKKSQTAIYWVSDLKKEIEV